MAGREVAVHFQCKEVLERLRSVVSEQLAAKMGSSAARVAQPTRLEMRTCICTCPEGLGVGMQFQVPY
jgi:hypothetical protein